MVQGGDCDVGEAQSRTVPPHKLNATIQMAIHQSLTQATIRPPRAPRGCGMQPEQSLNSCTNLCAYHLKEVLQAVSISRYVSVEDLRTDGEPASSLLQEMALGGMGAFMTVTAIVTPGANLAL